MAVRADDGTTGETIAELIERRFGLECAAGREQPAEGTQALLLRHRTHRRFTEAPVDEALLEAVLACGLSAPSKSDLQQASIIRVEDPERRAALAALVPDMPWVAGCPVFLVLCGDSRRIRRICELRGRPFANDHLDAVLNAASDAALVLGGLIAAAEAAGLGACPISVLRNRIERVIEILELPAHVFPLAGLCLGWPASAGHLSMRLPPRLTVHRDRYDDSNLAAEIDAYDRRRDAVYSIPPEKQRRRERYGIAAFYGWSEDKARQVSLRERGQLAAVLRRQGFRFD
jgi:nitroreductase/FMN reductase [NAD(P)H]